MLLKLFKYDILVLIKKCATVYITLLFALLLSIYIKHAYDKYLFFDGLRFMTFYVIFFISLIAPIVICGKNYADKMFSNEGYLTHTLPIEKYKMLNVKVLEYALIIFISNIVSFTCLVAFYDFDILGVLKFFYGGFQSIIGVGIIYTLSLIICYSFVFMLLLGSISASSTAIKNRNGEVFLIFLVLIGISSCIIGLILGMINKIDMEDVTRFFVNLAVVDIMAILGIILSYFLSLFFIKKKLSLV